MDYQIIATLGPASRTPQIWQELIAAGATAFRLNTSHLTLEQVSDWLQILDVFFETGIKRFPVVLDLQGSKWRLGDFPAVKLHSGERVDLVWAASSTEAGVVPVPHSDFFLAARSASADMTLNDAKVHLAIESLQDGRITARVLTGGPISARKGITFTACDYRVEAVNEKDQAILAQTAGFAGVRYAVSYLRDAREMQVYRNLAGMNAYLIAKLERGPAMQDAQAIAECANEVWLCRGDLGAEVGLVEMAAAAYRFSAYVRELPVPAVLAGQVLEHMTGQPAATRSEVCTLYDALQVGYAGFVLSDETAVGSYPIEAVRTAALYVNA
jgi:pyruvate kinase